MRVAAVALAGLLAGCSSLLGLDAPALVDAAVPPSDGNPPADAPRDALIDTAPATGCPASYNLSFGASYYRRITVDVPWLTAAQQCVADRIPSGRQTHLIVIGGESERSFVMPVAIDNTWLGLSDRATEGTYRWVTAEPTTYPPASGSPWAGNEPSGALGQDCVLVQQNGLFADDNCGASRSAICECDDYADDPARYTP